MSSLDEITPKGANNTNITFEEFYEKFISSYRAENPQRHIPVELQGGLFSAYQMRLEGSYINTRAKLEEEIINGYQRYCAGVPIEFCSDIGYQLFLLLSSISHKEVSDERS